MSKIYYVPRHFGATWVNARNICMNYGLDIATFKTLDEFNAVRDMCKENSSIMTGFIYIGGMTTSARSIDDWFWVTTGEKINFTMKWKEGEPNFAGLEYCLSIGSSDYLFNDIHCDSYSNKFICDKTIPIERIP